MDIAEQYVRLAHGVNTFHPGFIDSYVGDPVWAEPTNQSIAGLESACLQLETSIEALTDAARQDFLRVQVRAIRTALRLAKGEVLSYLEEASGLYDFEPLRVPESFFESAIGKLEALLPGSGDLAVRWQGLRKRFEVAPERLNSVIEVINLELRKRTKQVFELPEHEKIVFELVQNKPWGGYNWFLGKAVSRVEVNTDLPVFLYGLPDLVAHEGYPGHHTERIFKEQLSRLHGHAEHDLQLLNAPEAVLAEGIATNALEFVVAAAQLPSWLFELAPLAGLDLSLEDCELIYAVLKAQSNLRGVRTNAALMLHQDGLPEKVILEYLQQFAFINDAQARKALEFMKYARAYIHTYSIGYDLVHGVLQGHDRQAIFKRLLAEPITPSQLQALAS